MLQCCLSHLSLIILCNPIMLLLIIPFITNTILFSRTMRVMVVHNTQSRHDGGGQMMKLTLDWSVGSYTFSQNIALQKEKFLPKVPPPPKKKIFFRPTMWRLWQYVYIDIHKATIMRLDGILFKSVHYVRIVSNLSAHGPKNMRSCSRKKETMRLLKLSFKFYKGI